MQIIFNIDDKYQPAYDKYAGLGYAPEATLIEKLEPILEEIVSIRLKEIDTRLKEISPEELSQIENILKIGKLKSEDTGPVETPK